MLHPVHTVDDEHEEQSGKHGIVNTLFKRRGIKKNIIYIKIS